MCIYIQSVSQRSWVRFSLRPVSAIAFLVSSVQLPQRLPLFRLPGFYIISYTGGNYRPFWILQTLKELLGLLLFFCSSCCSINTLFFTNFIFPDRFIFYIWCVDYKLDKIKFSWYVYFIQPIWTPTWEEYYKRTTPTFWFNKNLPQEKSGNISHHDSNLRWGRG